MTRVEFNSRKMLTAFGKRHGYELRPYRGGHVVVYRDGSRNVATSVESSLWRLVKKLLERADA